MSCHGHCTESKSAPVAQNTARAGLLARVLRPPLTWLVAGGVAVSAVQPTTAAGPPQAHQSPLFPPAACHTRQDDKWRDTE